METGLQELVILSYGIVFFHPSVSLNNEKNCCKNSGDKIAVCERTAGVRSWKFPNLNSISVLESVSSGENISVPRHA